MMDLIALVESIVYAPYGGKPSDEEGVNSCGNRGCKQPNIQSRG